MQWKIGAPLAWGKRASAANGKKPVAYIDASSPFMENATGIAMASIQGHAH
jgi:hypothetical protein